MDKHSEELLEVLSPLAFGADQVQPLSPGIGSFRGRRVGIRHDKAWPSFDVFADEVLQVLQQQDPLAEVVWFDPGTRIGRPEQESARVAAFAAPLDVAIVGLGT